MKKSRKLFLTTAKLFLFACLYADHPIAAPAASDDMHLKVPAQFRAYTIAAVGAGRYCLAGDVFHDEVPNTSAMVALVDTNERRVVWKTDVPYAKDHYANTATDCVRDGDNYYVLTQEHTDSVPDRSQTELVLSKISATGKLLGERHVDIGSEVWANGIEAGPQGISIVGGTSTHRLDRDGKRSVFVARYDRDLSRKQLIDLPTGAFWEARAKLDGQSLLIAGEFLPNAGTAAAAHDGGYAVSKIDLGTARYVWSTFVYTSDVDASRAIFLPDGSTTYVGVDKAHLLVSVLDASGHVARRPSTQKTICTVDAVGIKGPVLQVVGTSCADQHSSLMLDVDSTNGQIVSSRQIGHDVTAVRFDGDALAAFSTDSTTDRKVFSRVTR